MAVVDGSLSANEFLEDLVGVIFNYYLAYCRTVSAMCKPYPDDVARCFLLSIIEYKSVYLFDVAKEFVSAYFKQPNIGYGDHVTAFEKTY